MLARRAAAIFWCVFGFVLWNAIFDDQVREAARVYLRLQNRHEQGIGPAVHMQDVMRPAIRRGAGRASAWAGGVTVAGLGAIAWASKRGQTPVSPPPHETGV